MAGIPPQDEEAMNSEEEEEEEEEEGWGDWEEDPSLHDDGGYGATVDLLRPSSLLHPSPQAALASLSSRLPFNLLFLLSSSSPPLSVLERIQVTNFLRDCTRRRRDPWKTEDASEKEEAKEEEVVEEIEYEKGLCAAYHQSLPLPSPSLWKKDKFLIAVVPDDPLLALMVEGADVEDEELAGKVIAERDEEENEEEMVEELRRGIEECGRKGEEEEKEKSGGLLGIPSSSSSSSSSFTSIDSSYFSSYSSFSIHREMLKDAARTEAYMTAITANPSLFSPSSRVLDVGTGTGILALFALRGGGGGGGVRHVTAVDASAKMAEMARSNAEGNGFRARKTFTSGRRDEKDGGGGGGGGEGAVVFDVICGKVEEIDSLPRSPPFQTKTGDTAIARGGGEGGGGDKIEEEEDGKVDILISEWMGYALLFEGMLDSVIHARNTFLKKGGALLPDIASLFLAGGGKDTNKGIFWEDVYGFKMEAIKEEVMEGMTKYGCVAEVKEEEVVTEPVQVKEYDLVNLEKEGVSFVENFVLVGKKKEEEEEEEEGVQMVHSIVLWFDVEFSKRFCKETPVTLSTSPFATPTHWAQTILLLRQPIALSTGKRKGGGEGGEGGGGEGRKNPTRIVADAIRGSISLSRSTSSHRSIDITLQIVPLRGGGGEAPCGEEQTLIYEI